MTKKLQAAGKIYRRNPRRKLSPSQVYIHIGRIRIGDLNKLFGLRYGDGKLYIFPDDDAGREDLKILLQHYGHTNPHKVYSIAKVRAPWMEAPEVWKLVEQVNAFPQKWRTATIGRLLNVTFEEWAALRLRTIKPAYVSEKDLAAYRKEQRRLRELRRRRKSGAKDRREYLAKNHVSRTKPWITAGVSRRTWYRHNKSNGTVAQLRGEYNLEHAVHGLVPSEKRRVSKEVVRAKELPLKSDQSLQSEKPNQSVAMTATLDLCQPAVPSWVVSLPSDLASLAAVAYFYGSVQRVEFLDAAE